MSRVRLEGDGTIRSSGLLGKALRIRWRTIHAPVGRVPMVSPEVAEKPLGASFAYFKWTEASRSESPSQSNCTPMQKITKANSFMATWVPMVPSNLSRSPAKRTQI